MMCGALRCKSALGFACGELLQGESLHCNNNLGTINLQVEREVLCRSSHAIIDGDVVLTLVAVRESSIRGSVSSRKHYRLFGFGGFGFGVPVVS